MLEGLLRSGESAWQFETGGSLRADLIPGFFAAWREHFAIENMMIKGKLRRISLWRFERAIQGRLLSGRPRMTLDQELLLMLSILVNRMLVRMPAGMGRTLQHILRGIRDGKLPAEEKRAPCA